MTAQILGIGIGSFILFNVWIITFFLCLVAIRTKKVIGLLSLAIATIITIVLIIIPKNSENSVSFHQKESDHYFIWHNILAVFSGLCAIGSIVLFCTEHATKPVNSKYIHSWITE